MMNCIASGGTYSTPETHQRHGGQQPERHTGRIGGGAHGTGDGRSTALRLQSYLEGVALYGTANPGAPGELYGGIKTGTAQTGVYENGEELLHFWYSGYIEDENGPRYTVTVLREATLDDKGLQPRYSEKLRKELRSSISKSTEDALFNQRRVNFFYFSPPVFYLSEKTSSSLFFSCGIMTAKADGAWNWLKNCRG